MEVRMYKLLKLPVFLLLFFSINNAFADSSPDYSRYGDLNSGHIYSKIKNPSRSGTVGYYSVKVIPSYYGKNGNFDIELKGKNIEGWAGLWIHTSDGNRKIMGFDNMSDRPIKGTTTWRKYKNKIYIPQGAKYISFGVLLQGEGRVDFRNFNFNIY